MSIVRARRAKSFIVVALGGLLAVATVVPAGAEPAISVAHALAPNVGGNLNNNPPYGAVWCSDNADCTLVGPGNLAEGNATVLTATSGTWGAPTAVDLPANATPTAQGGFSFLDGLSCWSAGNCVAVGGYAVTVGTGLEAVPEPEPMAVDEISGVWQTAQEITLPTTTDVQFGTLTATSCDSSGNCTAVGFYEDVDETTLSTETGLVASTQAMGETTWTAASSVPSPPGSYFVVLPIALSCSDATTCTAIAYGLIGSDSFLTGEFLSEASGTWSANGSVGSVGGEPVTLNAMSCPDAGDCLAVGSSFSNQPVVEAESGGTWGAARGLPLPLLSPVSDEGQLDGVSCLSATQCVAVGAAQYGHDHDDAVGLVESNTGAGWSGTYDEAPVRAGQSIATVVDLGPVQCFSLTDCFVVGAAGLGTSDSLTHVSAFWSTVSASERVTVAGKPSDLVIKPGPVTTKVSFSPPTSDGGSKILYFTVTAKSKGEATRTCVTPGESCTFKGAVKGKVYSVTVTTRTKAGTSAPSTPKTFVAT